MSEGGQVINHEVGLMIRYICVKCRGQCAMMTEEAGHPWRFCLKLFSSIIVTSRLQRVNDREMVGVAVEIGSAKLHPVPGYKHPVPGYKRASCVCRSGQVRCEDQNVEGFKS